MKKKFIIILDAVLLIPAMLYVLIMLGIHEFFIIADMIRLVIFHK